MSGHSTAKPRKARKPGVSFGSKVSVHEYKVPLFDLPTGTHGHPQLKPDLLSSIATQLGPDVASTLTSFDRPVALAVVEILQGIGALGSAITGTSTLVQGIVWATSRARKARSNNKLLEDPVHVDKMICVDKVVEWNPGLEGQQKELEVAALAIPWGEDPREETASPLTYVIVPVARLTKTYFFVVVDGRPLHYVTIPHGGRSGAKQDK